MKLLGFAALNHSLILCIILFSFYSVDSPRSCGGGVVGLVAYPCVYNLLIKVVAPFPFRIFDFGADFFHSFGFAGGDDFFPCFQINAAF